MADFFIRLVREKPLGAGSGIVIVILILVGIFADVLAPYPYDEPHIRDMMKGPSVQYLLGTDQLGRDSLSRIVYRTRTSLLVGLATTALGVVVSTLIGGTSGFLGGKLDLGVQRFVDAWMSFPGLLLLLTVMSIVGRGVPQIILVLGIAGGIGGSRVLRGAVIDIKENVYFESAEAIGSSKWRAFVRHVVPNIMPVIIIGFSINIGGAAAGSLARSRPDHYRLLSQHVRRRGAGSARPAAQGRWWWSRRRNMTSGDRLRSTDLVRSSGAERDRRQRGPRRWETGICSGRPRLP